MTAPVRAAFGGVLAAAVALAGQASGAGPAGSSQRQFLDRYRGSCHNERAKSGGLSLAGVEA